MSFSNVKFASFHCIGEFDTPKSDSSIRVVDLSPEVLKALVYIHSRDLGHGGVRLLLDTESNLPPGVMVTMQDCNLVPVPFEDLVDPKTNRTRIRQVDLGSYAYSVARAYMIRLEPEDFQDQAMLRALASEVYNV